MDASTAADVAPLAGLAPGTSIDGRYTITGLLGRGAMGVVLEGRHRELGTSVAVKVLTRPLSGAGPQRFLREARACSQVVSEHVARVMDYGTLEDGRPFMVMERLEGADLKTRLAAAPLGVAETLEVVRQAAEGLAAAHAAGVVHRDVKPANLFVTERADGTIAVKVLDFGISRMESDELETLTQSQSVLGTPYYMSPEQVRSPHHVDARTDLWSLGVVLYECLSGSRPFDGPTASAVFAAILEQPLPALEPSAPARLVSICERCLRKDPNARFDGMPALIRALEDTTDDLAAPPPRVVLSVASIDPAGATEDSTMTKRRATQRVLSRRTLAVVATVLAGAFGSFIALGGDEGRKELPPGGVASATASGSAPEVVPLPSLPESATVDRKASVPSATVARSSVPSTSQPPRPPPPTPPRPAPSPRPTLY